MDRSPGTTEHIPLHPGSGLGAVGVEFLGDAPTQNWGISFPPDTLYHVTQPGHGEKNKRLVALMGL